MGTIRSNQNLMNVNLTDKVAQIGKNVTHHPMLKEIFNDIIMKKISISALFSSWSCNQYRGLDYIIRHSKDFKHSGKGAVEMSNTYDDNYHSTAHLSLFVPNTEAYILMEDNRTICHIEPMKFDSIDSDGESKYTKITFIGKNAYVYMHGFTKTIKKYYERRINGFDKQIGNSMYISTIKENGIVGMPYKLCNFEDVIMKNKEDIIIKPLQSFFEAKDLYAKYKVAYKLGILLYGVPGTGKTTLTRAIINATLERFNTNCYLLNLNSDSEKLDKQLETIYQNASNNVKPVRARPPINIIILEEIDSIFPKDRENCSEEQLEKISTLLQFLDGPMTPANAMFIATTNRKDKLDEAMIRDGRFSIQINMDNFDKDEAEEMCNRYDVPMKEIIDMKDKDKIRPATLQKLIFNYIMDNKVLQKND